MQGREGRKHLYHMAPKVLWGELKGKRQPYFPPTYEQDGFIHLTEDPNALETVFNNFYTAKDPWDWTCLVIDPAKLTSKVVFEPAAPVGKTPPPSGYTAADGPLFPHLYGTIDYDAVLEEAQLRRDSTGRFMGIDGVTASGARGVHS